MLLLQQSRLKNLNLNMLEEIAAVIKALNQKGELFRFSN
jgi:hypothetical protein